MPMGSKGWNEVPGILTGDRNAYVECSWLQGCLSLEGVLYRVLCFCEFDLNSLLSLPVFPKEIDHANHAKWSRFSCEPPCWTSLRLQPFFSLPRVLSFCRTARIWHFITVSLLIYSLFIPHLPPKEVFREPYPSRPHTSAIFSFGVCFRAAGVPPVGLVSISKPFCLVLMWERKQGTKNKEEMSRRHLPASSRAVV